MPATAGGTVTIGAACQLKGGGNMPTTITAYTFAELTGAARERALNSLPDADCDNTLNECMASLRALCKVAGVTLDDWSIGPYSYSYLKVSFARDEVADLSGPRAMAWVENNIFSKLRQSWRPAMVPPNDKWASVHGKYSRRYARPDYVRACPLTGICFDEDLLDVFRGGVTIVTLKERFGRLADIITRICEAELVYQDGEGREERAKMEYEDALFDKRGHRLQ